MVLLLACVVGGCSRSDAQSARFAADDKATPIENVPPVATTEPADSSHVDTAIRRVSFAAEAIVDVPEVLLTAQHEALCHVKVGNQMPAIELPKVGGGQAKLADLYGDAATVVVFWKGDRRMALDELADLGPDVVEPYGSRGVSVVGIAVEESMSDARAVLSKAGADFTNLLDADGQAFAKVGSEKLPWTLVLDPAGTIVWFDMEYSHATRRELQQTLQATLR